TACGLGASSDAALSARTQSRTARWSAGEMHLVARLQAKSCVHHAECSGHDMDGSCNCDELVSRRSTTALVERNAQDARTAAARFLHAIAQWRLWPRRS